MLWMACMISPGKLGAAADTLQPSTPANLTGGKQQQLVCQKVRGYDEEGQRVRDGLQATARKMDMLHSSLRVAFQAATTPFSTAIN